MPRQRTRILLALLVIGATGGSCFLGGGMLFVWASPHEELRVLVDGKQVKRVQPGLHAALPLRMGLHDVKLSSESGEGATLTALASHGAIP